MADRYVELALPKRNLVARARLLDQEAPQTCQLLWERLPIAAETIHAQFSGCKLYVLFPWDGTPVPRENFTVCTDAGDLFFVWSGWSGPAGAGTVEVAVFYDRDAVPMGANAPHPGVLFATVVDNLSGFAEAGEAIWREGSETLIISRSGESESDTGRPA